MRNDYLNASSSKDLKNLKDKVLYRFFEILPGFFSWSTLLGAFTLSWLAPAVAAVFIIIFDIYWLLKISYLSFHQISSYKKMRSHLKVNWLYKLKKIDGWRKIYHLIILPAYKEESEIIRSTLESLKKINYPKDRLIVVLSVEERAGKRYQETAKVLKQEFSHVFFRFLVTVHPKNIIGEIAGRGSNVAWAIRKAREEILDLLKIPEDNVIVSAFDIDTRPYSQYFACLTYYFLKVHQPLRSSYQPIPVYNNNIWQAPAFSRVISVSSTFWQMMQQERQEQLVTYSSHSSPFKVLNEVGYPNNVVPDDSHIFWKSYFYYDGDFRVVPLYYPVSMDTVQSKNLFKTIINQYKQQRRWAWGCTEIPYVIFCFLKNKKISLREKIRQSFILLDGFWSWATSALLIFFLGWLPLILGGESFNVTLLSYNLPRLTAYIMTAAMAGMIISSIISFLLLPPRPSGYSKIKTLSMIFQWLLLPVTLIVFGAIPALDAQTRLILDKPLGFWVTEKTRH